MTAGAAGAFLVSAALVPFRDHIHNANVALLLVLPVLAAAVIGGRWAGAAGAVIAAMVFDFFFTVPYQSLKINSGSDVVTLVLFAVVALVTAEVGLRSRRVERNAWGRRGTSCNGCSVCPSSRPRGQSAKTSCRRSAPS